MSRDAGSIPAASIEKGHLRFVVSGLSYWTYDDLVTSKMARNGVYEAEKCLVSGVEMSSFISSDEG
jgi:hypothetical protein